MHKKKVPQIVKEIRKFIPSEIDYGHQTSVSYSQLSLYMNCPHRWALQYKEGIKMFTSSIHTVFGTALHKTLQQHLTTMYEESSEEADREDTVEIFENNLREEYSVQYKKNNNQHFSSSDELREFFEDGTEIINFFKKRKSAYFSKRDWFLVGCEVPILIIPNKRHSNVIYKGFLDVVMYHEPTNTFKIIDIKTSGRSWGKDKKTDSITTSQLILYKKFFSELFKVPIDSISIEYFIVKRKVPKSSNYPISRIQTFSPPSGKTSVKKSTNYLENFIEESFDKGGYKDKEHEMTEGKHCVWCPFHKTIKCKATFGK